MMPRSRDLLLPALVTLLLYGGLLILVLRNGYPVSSFILAGDQFVDRSVPIVILEYKSGYDGQFYYGLAVDPYFSHNPSNGITLDIPHYRQQRIVFPLLVHVLSFGQQKFVPTVMVLVNLISICLVAFLGGLFARQQNKSVWYGLAFPLFPGFFITFTRDLVEILVAVFLLAFMVIPRNKQGLAVFLLSMAILTKETALLFALAILCSAFFQKWEKWKIYFVPPTTYLFWQILLFLKWGVSQSVPIGNIGVLFVSFFDFFGEIMKENKVLDIIFLCFIIFFTVIIVLQIFNGKNLHLYLRIAFGFYFLLVFSLSKFVWLEIYAYLRAITEFYLIGVTLLLLKSGNLPHGSQESKLVLETRLFCKRPD